ncbi:hypothetical protein D3C77_509430 [compost metagenome]
MTTEIVWQLPTNQSSLTDHDWIHPKAKWHGFVNGVSLCKRHRQGTRAFESRDVLEVMDETEFVCKRCLEFYGRLETNG